jgi:hypothetical protein
MTNQDQLPRVVAAFEQWRNNRNGRQVATPAQLANHFLSSHP